jgi:hypothetical protein
MNRRQRFFWGLLILLLTPLVVLAAFVVYVYVANARPQSGDLQTRVSPQVVMPWGESVYYISYSGFSPAPTPVATVTPVPTPTPPPSQIDMVFIVDESSSMTSSIGAMAAAAETVVQDLATERRGRIRYAAIRFDVTADTQTDWTDKPDQLVQGLTAIAQAPKGRGTDGRVALSKLQELLATARPNADKVVIFYTDGLIAMCPSCADEITEAARKLRDEQQVDFYSVGLPYQGSDPLMTEITGDPYKVFDPLNPTELARMFQEIKVAVGAAPSASGPAGSGPRTPKESGGYLTHRLDGRHFATPLEGTNWNLGGGSINLLIRPIPEGPNTFAHPLVPLSAGLWSVGIEPPRLVFFDKAGQRHLVVAQRRPLLLKVTYFTLLLMLLPAVLWTLAHLWPRRKPAADVPEPVLDLPPILAPTLPEPLPLLPRLTVEPLVAVPTLFLGLGGAGRRALHAVRADLKQAHLGGAGEPYSFLWIDTDTQEVERDLPFEDWEDYPMQSSIAPAAVRQTESYLPEPTQIPDHLKWFNPNQYRDAARPLLNLLDGSKGERPLARLALFKWLAIPNGILTELIEQFNRLAACPAPDGTRQIIIFGSADGGIGSGWFLDFGRLFQRIAHQQQSEGLEALPDVIGVLCEDPEERHPENRQALAMELDTALTTRKFPRRVTYAPDEALLDEVDAQRPYHWIFAVESRDKNSVAAQCGQLASVLIERQPRAGLLDLTQRIPTDTVATATIAAHILPMLIFDQVRCELFLRILGPDILLDVTPDALGGLKPQPVPGDRAAQLLDDWVRMETPGNPLQVMLRAAVDPAAVPGFEGLIPPAAVAPLPWFGEAFAAALTERLQGHAAGDSGWERTWMPGEAVATLRLLVARLERNLKPDLTTRNASAQTMELVDHMISLADSAAGDLERWVQDFCVVCEQVATQRSKLEQARRNLLSLQGRTYLDLETSPDQIQRWARSSLETWLGTPDTISAIRRRLFFAITTDGARCSASVQSFIAKEPQPFATASQVAGAIDQLARSLAQNVPAGRIGGVLAEMPANGRRDLARELMRPDSQPQQVLLVQPQTAGLTREEQEVIEEFSNSIPKPPTHGPRSQKDGNDHSAIRRLELAEATVEQSLPTSQPLTFVELAETTAEALRRRAEKKYQIGLPVFPPRLRMALAHPAAFRSFARAYKAGHIVSREDDTGNEQWSFTDTGQFLTFGRESSLAHAAANYAQDVKNHPESFAVAGDGGNFIKLNQWVTQRPTPDADTLTQIAVEVYEY